MKNPGTIKSLIQKGLLTEIDIHFAQFISGFSPNSDPDVYLAAALVSHATGSGDICLDLDKAADRLLHATQDFEDPIHCPALNVWLEKLKNSPTVGYPGQIRPLVLDKKNRLYLYRYWNYENTLSKSIESRVQRQVAELDLKRLENALKRLFPGTDPQETNWQKIAAAIACLKQFSVITGGPGTGKTFTVTRVLALLLELLPGQKLQIYLTTPTGKAAARLKESVEQAKGRLSCHESIKTAIPSEVFTIHRMLKPIPGSPYFRHDRNHLLMADVVVVDEASMVDLALMAKLFDAVPENARLILIGDKDQLASVEAGSVLGDICDRDVMHGFSAPLRNRIKAITGEDLEHEAQTVAAPIGLQDAIVVLQKEFRFAADSSIGALSRAVNHADTEFAFEIMADEEDKSVVWQPLRSDLSIMKKLSQQIVSGYRSCLKVADPVEALKRLQQFKILCALNIGPLGVQAVNKLAERVLSRHNLIQPDPTGGNPWYAGRPVLITRNDYSLGLFNGHIGVALPDAGSNDHRLSVFFSGDAGEVRQYYPHQLPEHETVYAMTVHKSQGSEFDEVILLLPDRDYPVLTRELIYTALTRAREKITIWARRSILSKAIARRITRSSGLRDALWEVRSQMAEDLRVEARSQT